MTSKFRSLESISDSEEEIHPNIDTKSYRKFIKEERKRRLDFLRSKETLSDSETKELRILEYKELPLLVEVEPVNFRTSSSTELPQADKMVEEILNLETPQPICLNNASDSDRMDDITINFIFSFLENSTVENFINMLDEQSINLHELEDLSYVNLAEAIKDGDDTIGLEFCKIGLLASWAIKYGRSYLIRLKDNDNKLPDIVSEHYKKSKEAILGLNE